MFPPTVSRNSVPFFVSVSTPISLWLGQLDLTERQMERLFDQSGLVWEKWRDRADYRERTIREVVKETTEYYEPRSD